MKDRIDAGIAGDPNVFADSFAAQIFGRGGSVCEVQSRAEIDNDPAAFARFEERIRRPWIEATRERAA